MLGAASGILLSAQEMYLRTLLLLPTVWLWREEEGLKRGREQQEGVSSNERGCVHGVEEKDAAGKERVLTLERAGWGPCSPGISLGANHPEKAGRGSSLREGAPIHGWYEFGGPQPLKGQTSMEDFHPGLRKTWPSTCPGGLKPHLSCLLLARTPPTDHRWYCSKAVSLCVDLETPGF